MIDTSNTDPTDYMKVLHLFNIYPNQTMNWAFNLIHQLPDTKSYASARQFLINSSYNTGIENIQNPFGAFHKHFKDSAFRHKYWNLGKILVRISEILKLETNHLTTQIKNRDIQILHAHFADTGCYYADLAKQCNIPYVVSFYGFDYEYLPFTQPGYREKYQQLFKIADLFICEGKHGAKTLGQLGCPAEKIRVVHLGVDLNKISFFERPKKPNTLQLIQIANFTEKKGHLYTIKAFHKALLSAEHMHLTLIGKEKKAGGQIKNSIIDYIEKNNFADKVTLIDRIDYGSLHTYLKDFHVFIHPSCYGKDRDCEGGAPIVLLDAQATGMPVISTNHCDIPGEVIHEKSGLLSNEKDIKSLAAHILQFCKMDDDAYSDYCRASRKHVETSFDLTVSGSKLKQYYLELKL